MSLPPLHGLKVIECCEVLAGPYCGMLLADAGADVVKVERVGVGDSTRSSKPPTFGPESAIFVTINRNKRSLTLNVKEPRGQQILKELAESADVLVENYRPGTMDALGLGYEALSQVNPRLIYCSISGFGQTGPYRERGGFDLVAQGMSGVMSFTGEPGGRPIKPGVPISDLGTGRLAAFHILAAFVARERTGRGQHIDLSLLETCLALTIWESSLYFATGKVAQPLGSAHRVQAPYQAVRAKDGYLTIGGAKQSIWERLCVAISAPQLLEDERFTTTPLRKKHLAQLVEILESIFVTRTRAEWMAILQEHGVPCGPIYDMAEVWADPQVVARGMLVEQDHPTAGRHRTIGVPAKFSDTPVGVRTPSPLLGQHTDEILAALGYSEPAIRELRDEGVV